LIDKIQLVHSLFWKKNPVLLLSISFLFGSSGYIYPKALFLLPFWLFYLALAGQSALCRGVFLASFSWIYAFFLYGKAPHPEGPIYIEGIFCPYTLSPHQSPFQRGFIYKGSLYIPEKIPCSICVPLEKRTNAGQDYLVKGTFYERAPFAYSLKVDEWSPVPFNIAKFHLAEMRYRYKEKFRSFLQKNLSPKSATLLSSLATGDVEDRSLRYEFGRLGLQHILSISGFHFALLISFLSGSLGLFLPEKIKLWVLLLALSAYFLFVGSAPAVLRSFLMASFYLVGKLLRRNASSLNLLGCALLIEMILNPLASSSIGFQLSFLSSASLLLLFPFFEKALELYLPKRDRKNLSTLKPSAAFGYLLSSFLRKSVATTLAVNTALLPILLLHFHKFPLLSLIYNLFFPFAVAISIFLLLTSLGIYLFFPLLGKLFLIATDFWTKFLLDLASNPPLFFDRSILFNQMPFWLCAAYLFLLFLLSIQAQNKQN